MIEQMWTKLLARALSTHVGRVSVIQWYLQLDYRDLKILILNEPDRRREVRKKHKAS